MPSGQMAAHQLLTQLENNHIIHCDDFVVENLSLFAEIDSLLSDERKVHLLSSDDTTISQKTRCGVDADSIPTSLPVVVERKNKTNIIHI